MATSICDKLQAGVITTTAAETQALARELAAVIPPDTVLALHGNLGAGKTTFVQGLALGLGVTEAVTSPTFTLFNVHRGTRARLVHLDAYRLDGDAQLEALMLEDFLESPWVLAVEWPERIAGWLPAEAWHLELAIDHEERHTLRFR
jgi:tRNA threonylcarbamoyladenosine biosynthesis protein TsaE